MTSMSLVPTRRKSRQTCLSSYKKYGCEVAPDEAFDALAHKIFAFQFAHNMQYRAYCMSRRVTPQMLSDWMDIPPMPVDGFKMLTLTSVPEDDCEAVFMTSGTTHPGQRGRNYHPDLEVWDASMIGRSVISSCLTVSACVSRCSPLPGR